MGNGGFTIIEMTMVVFIMAMMFTVGAASYRDYQQREYLDGAVSMIEDDIKLARQLSLSGRYFTGCDQLIGYEIRVFPDDLLTDPDAADENIYEIGAWCDGNERCNNKPATHCIHVRELPEGIKISGIAGIPGNRVTFLTQGRGIEQGNNDATITLSLPGSGVANRQIIIRRSGGIEIQ